MTEFDELVDASTAQVPDEVQELQAAMRACKCRSCTWALRTFDSSQWEMWSEPLICEVSA